ncbi:MAG: hypothetical protein WCJ71_00045 [Candidatus Omnitrophota bacterium]
MDSVLTNCVTLIVIVGFVLGIVFLVFLRPAQEKIKRLAVSLGASSVPSFFRLPGIKGDYEGAAFEVAFRATKSPGIVALRITLFHAFMAEVDIFSSVSGPMDKFLNKNPLLKKMMPYFAGLEHPIYTDDTVAAENFLQSERIKKTIDKLFAIGFSLISVRKNKIFINSDYFLKGLHLSAADRQTIYAAWFRDDAYDPEDIRTVLKNLSLIAKG